MTSEQAIRHLDEKWRSDDLDAFRQLVDAAERELVGEDSVRFLLHACDLLSSHDLGDHEAQLNLMHRYARWAFNQNLITSLEREFRILAHLAYDHKKSAESDTDWQARRLSLSRRWLHALNLTEQECEKFEINRVPDLKALLPKGHLPAGISPSQVSELDERAKYLNSIEINRHRAEAFEVGWRLKQLTSVYRPMAARYILSAYGREPFDLDELAELLAPFAAEPRRVAHGHARSAAADLSGLQPPREVMPLRPSPSGSAVKSDEVTAKERSSHRRKSERRTKPSKRGK